jgi:integrase/recombinase XerC
MKNAQALLKGFMDYLKGCGLSRTTVERSYYLVGRFLAWLNDEDVREVDDKKIGEYREYLSMLVSRFTGKPLKRASLGVEMSAVKSFFEYLFRHELILKNPLEGIRFAEHGESSLRKIFSEAEIARFLDSIPVTNPATQRDRALFELMYSSGLRVNEALNIEFEYLNLDERVVLIKMGKGKKDRYVPFSEAALRFLLAYVENGRKRQLELIKRLEDKRYVFLGGKGKVSYRRMRRRFQDYLESCGLKHRGYTMHSIRHTAATHLLQHGASIRYVQELLGHEDLKTTQLYTRPQVENIKRVYRTYHPRENEYFKEVDEEYLRHLEELREELLKKRF